MTLIIDEGTIKKYNDYYFSIHTKAKKEPIKQPYHESINQWMILKRPMMNTLKQRWKAFTSWFIEDQGYSNLLIERCRMTFCVYYPTNRRHDPDNTVPKFILDGMVESGFIVDDDMNHIRSLTLACDVDTQRPRTEINITILE